jgi:hypothetical protein
MIGNPQISRKEKLRSRLRGYQKLEVARNLDDLGEAECGKKRAGR